MVTELDEHLGYDADHDDPRQFCEHGTFMGSWWGPDYMCGWCEDGASVEIMTWCQLNTTVRNLKASSEAIPTWIRLADSLAEKPSPKLPYSVSMANWMVNMLLSPEYEQPIADHLKRVRRAQARVRLFKMQHPDIEAETERCFG